jgi:hypothetical protein
MNEMPNMEAIVNDKALKNPPLTPDKNAKGKWVTIVAAEEAANGLLNSAAAA